MKVVALLLGVLLVGSLAERPKRRAAIGKAHVRALQENDTPTWAPAPRATPAPDRGGADSQDFGGHTNDPACGTCMEPHDSPGCSDDELEACVCGMDPFCCNVVWDQLCVDQVWLCDSACFGQDDDLMCAGNCGISHGGMGCEVPEIQQCVCDYDSWCCDMGWDSICVGEVWGAPCRTDCDCEGDDHYRDDELPAYWSTIADQYSVNTSLLGFNVASGKWCYGLSNTCVKWGEWNGLCDDGTFACAGHEQAPQTNGHGPDQMAMVAEVDGNDYQHWMCPVCEYNDMCPNGAYPGTDNETTATFTDCWCNEHHSGYPLVFQGYWWNQAIAAGLNPMDVTQRNGKWYHQEDYTCVAKGAYGDPCNSATLGCVCSGGTIYGSASAQLADVLTAYNNGGQHPSCPY